MSGRERKNWQWPAWIDDVLRYGPIAELETEWRAAIGDAITAVLDQRRADNAPPSVPEEQT